MKLDLETGELSPQRKTAQHREVYFVQARTLGLVKIGVANNAVKRLRQLAHSSPDRLDLLGAMPCHRFGKTEEELHLIFAADRRHGEWFAPSERLLDFIIAHAWNPARKAVLQAVLDRPTMPRGRPRRDAKGTKSAKPEKNRSADAPPFSG